MDVKLNIKLLKISGVSMKDNQDWIYMLESLQKVKSFNRALVRRGSKEYEIQAEHIELLSHLAVNKFEMTAMELSRMMNVNKTIISRIVELLNKKGYVEKKSDANDKRRYFLSITKLGEEALDQIYEYYLHPIYELRRGLGDESFFELMDYIEKSNIKIRELEGSGIK